jgi:hypothetical protein
MLYERIGRPESARTEFSAAIELYRAMDMTFWLPQAGAALARVDGQDGGSCLGGTPQPSSSVV